MKPSVTERRLDVLAIGDAVVDIIARADDAFLDAHAMVKGSMRVLSESAANALYGAMGPAQEMSGGSAANSMAGIAAMGGRAGFVGQTGADRFGEIFAHDLAALGVAFDTPPLDEGPGTGRCLILVTPDGERTMNTYRGASERLDGFPTDAARAARVVLLEAYLWDHERPRHTMRAAAKAARGAGAEVAFTLSDIACIARHRDDLRALVESGAVDILLGNAAEATALSGEPDLPRAMAALAERVPCVVATDGAQGAHARRGGEIVSVPALPPADLVDSTGAGDMFAAGFLLERARGRPLRAALETGVRAATDILSRYGARPMGDLAHLRAQR